MLSLTLVPLNLNTNSTLNISIKEVEEDEEERGDHLNFFPSLWERPVKSWIGTSKSFKIKKRKETTKNFYPSVQTISPDNKRIEGKKLLLLYSDLKRVNKNCIIYNNVFDFNLWQENFCLISFWFWSSWKWQIQPEKGCDIYLKNSLHVNF